MVIDFHTHAFPDSIAQKAISSLEEKGNIKAFSDGTICALIGRMDKDSIDTSIVHSIATKPSQQTNVNNFAISLLDNPRIIPFGSVYPGSESAIYEIERLHDAGIKGIKLHPEYQNFFSDQEETFEIYQRCAQFSMPIMLHCGQDVAFPPPVHASPDRIEKVVSMFSDTTFICAHMGGYNLWDEFFDKVQPHENLYIDTSMTNTVAILNNGTATSIINKHGANKILFGSDFPWETPEKSKLKVLSFGLDEEKTECILYKNAKKLLGLS